jgi:hypothetical protein
VWDLATICVMGWEVRNFFMHEPDVFTGFLTQEFLFIGRSTFTISGCASVKDNHGMDFGLLYFTVVIFDLVNDGHNLEIINRNLEYVRNLEYMIKLIIKENEKCNR